MNKLTKNDYLNILKYYKISTKTKNINQIKSTAEDILAKKLCKCIKKVNKSVKNEPRAIALCKTSVLHKKGIKTFRFTCKKKNKLLPKKGTTIRIIKRVK
jgi:hypothetical protein